MLYRFNTHNMNKPYFLICVTNVVDSETLSFPVCVEFWEEMLLTGKDVFLYIPNMFWQKYPSIFGLERLLEYVENIEESVSICLLVDKKFHKIVFDLFMENKDTLCLGVIPILFLEDTKETFECMITTKDNLLAQKEIREYVISLDNEIFLN